MQTQENIPLKQAHSCITLTTPQAAEYLGLAVSTLNKWRCWGGGPAYLKLGRAVRYRQEDLDAFMGHHKTTSTAEYEREHSALHVPSP